MGTPVASGLTHEQARARLVEVGRNVLAEPKRPSALRRFAANLVHLFAVLLWIGAALALVGGLPELTAAILVVILVNAALRLLPIGQIEGQQTLAALRPLMVSLANAAAMAGPDEMWSFAPGLEIAGLRHAELDLRLFRS